MTECKQSTFHFHTGSRRQGQAAFDGGTISSDGGVLLLGQVERATGILRQFATCFADHCLSSCSASDTIPFSRNESQSCKSARKGS